MLVGRLWQLESAVVPLGNGGYTNHSGPRRIMNLASIQAWRAQRVSDSGELLRRIAC